MVVLVDDSTYRNQFVLQVWDSYLHLFKNVIEEAHTV